MKIFIKRVISLTLIFALTLLSGCGKDNMKLSASIPNGGDLSYLSSTNSQLVKDFEESLVEELLTESTESFLKNSSEDIKASSSFVPENSLLGTSSVDFSESKTPSATVNNSSNITSSIQKPSTMPFRAIWISYFEFPFWGNNEATAKEKLLSMMQTLKNQGYTAVFCHVRANADAFYPSKYFPFAMQLTGVPGGNPGYDPLKIMIWAAKKCGLEIHAWINPYRVSNLTANPEELAEGHIAKEWFYDESGRVFAIEKGLYFNPASTDVQRLVLNGIREILANYSVDGIHFDDYFYPEKMSQNADEKQYNKYLQSAENPLSLGDWRRANVNALVSAVYRLCHSKKVIFGISPAANISLNNSHDNYNKLYADIALWMREEGYVDYLLPQLYFGYKHPVKAARYDYLLNIWATLPKHKNLKFYVGLGAYRMNSEVEDKEEWHNETDLMARQVADAYKVGAEGFAVFSYESSVLKNEHNSLQIKNMFEVINSLS